MVCASEIKAIFRQSELFSLEEIKKSLEKTMEYFKNDDEPYYTKETRLKRFELCEKFLKKLNKLHLPTLENDWWCYHYSFTKDGIDLSLSYCKDIEIHEDEEGKFISCMTYDKDTMLLSVKCEYLNIEQFASLHKVNPATILKWIKLGKLRHIKRVQGEWQIPAIECLPTDYYIPPTYSWEEPPKEILDGFPIIGACKSITIFQDRDNKGKFNCKLWDIGININLSKKEVEELEYLLITSDLVEVDGNPLNFIPNIEKND